MDTFLHFFATFNFHSFDKIVTVLVLIDLLCHWREDKARIREKMSSVKDQTKNAGKSVSNNVRKVAYKVKRKQSCTQ